MSAGHLGQVLQRSQTGVAVLCKVNGDLAADASGCAHDQGDLLGLTHGWQEGGIAVGESGMDWIGAQMTTYSIDEQRLMVI